MLNLNAETYEWQLSAFKYRPFFVDKKTILRSSNKSKNLWLICVDLKLCRFYLCLFKKWLNQICCDKSCESNWFCRAVSVFYGLIEIISAWILAKFGDESPYAISWQYWLKRLGNSINLRLNIVIAEEKLR